MVSISSELNNFSKITFHENGGSHGEVGEVMVKLGKSWRSWGSNSEVGEVMVKLGTL